ncbi:CDP-glucose 4,6-dehydratase [Effusibacillus consociatus]|uniref:CDP-glucose 4,6-dehydratase n=1 Tax=Effusibacillus consociatus TaxID=1117041 RepID=A0ABV9PWC3_9BACL
MLDHAFWNNKKVFVTGHTGFKGSWLCLWLYSLGAKVTGYSLQPPTNPSMFQLCQIDQLVSSITADIRDIKRLRESLFNADPDIVIHMAAQPLVRESYQSPAETYEINVMGTINLFEAVRSAVNQGKRIKSVINVTSDKCYQNREWSWGYRENDSLGGYDPYSSSKACSELITSSYRSSFFHPKEYAKHGVGLASARAGNVIGGGDWAADRLLPDCIRALLTGKEIMIRNPKATRPWQHVLEPVSGYLLLAEKLYQNGPIYAEGWNFGPNDDDVKPVEWIVKEVCEKWGENAGYKIVQGNQPHEAGFLKLDCSKAKWKLGWNPRWDLEHAICKVIEWTRIYRKNQDLKAISLKQIEEYTKASDC